MLGLRKISDRVVSSGSSTVQSSNQAAKSAYTYAMNHPKTTAAVVLGTGVAAALLWLMQRNGGYQEVRKQVLKRVRSA
ncbi:MAG: hypothetical protein A3G81_01335 [Betaproteobacteria bacterium RIFCSPLOWO2_12_FULL_65_14]|nr:MAG: hypothetical protein A3G81_01335 [Betaproteobacteria bacterium RIFCSPLOWO2_12_FULL_65_14]